MEQKEIKGNPEGNFTPFSNLLLLRINPEKVPQKPRATMLTPEFLRYLLERYKAKGLDPQDVTLKQALEDQAALVRK